MGGWSAVGKLTPALRKELEQAKKDKRLVKDVADIPVWVKMALTYKAMFGYTHAECIKAIGRAQGIGALEAFARSPAGKEWVAGIRKNAVADQRELALSVLRATALGITLDKLGALQMATEAKDYKAINVITDSLLDRADLNPKKGGNGVAPTIIVNLGIQTQQHLLTEGTIIDAEVIDEQEES